MLHEYEAKYKFENGYGASVVRGVGTYGGGHGLFELAVMHCKELCYATTITDDVVGHLDHEEVNSLLTDIEQLPINVMCSHDRAPQPQMFEISVRYYTHDEHMTAESVSAVADEALQYAMNGDDWFKYLKVVG